MKKITIILLVLISLCTNSCYAKAQKFSKELQKAYADEVETFVSNELDKSIEEANTWYLKANTVYAQFMKNKNHMKQNKDFITTLELYEEDITSPEFDLYKRLIDITKKYDSNVENEVPATGFAGTLYDFLVPYFKKNNVKYSKLDDLSTFIAIKAEKIEGFKNEIYNYSYLYEQNKVDNFYNKVILPKLEATKLTNLFYILMGNGKPKIGVHYFAKPQVIQVLSGGFLADLSAYQEQYNGVIYVKDSNSNKLMAGDVFNPFLPMKFTGQYYYYKNFYGESRQVPIMVVAFPACSNNALPQIGEQFYFAEKPHYTYNNEDYCIKGIYVINDRRAYRNVGNPYMRWK